jgi:hypothetical protein
VASQRETNTMAEGLQRVLNEITKMKVMPDGDLPFLVQLETEILQYLKAPSPDQGQQQAPPQQSPLDGAMSQVMGGAPPMAGPGGGGPPPLPLGTPDEALRMLGRSAQRSTLRRIGSRISSTFG